MADELTTEVEVLVPIKLTFKGRPKGNFTTSFGEKFNCKGNDAERLNLP